jgi:tetratricopeptide (TPR) repeat protein
MNFSFVFRVALLNNQMTEEAITYYRKAIELKPGFKQAQQSLNIALRQLKK